MKLSVLLITGKSDRTALETVENIAGQASGQVKDIFLIIAGDFSEDNRKKLYLERSAQFGMTAFINVGDKSEAELLNTFIKFANADFCTVMRAGGKTDPDYFGRLIRALEQDDSLNIACGVRVSDTADCFTPSAQPCGAVDLSKNYGCFPRSLEGTVVRTSYAAERPFDMAAGGFAEQKCALTMLSECGKFYFDNSIKIWLADGSPRPEELPEEAYAKEYHTNIFDKLILPLEESCKGKDGRLPLFLQHYVTAEALERVRDGMALESFPEEDRSAVLETLTKALGPVEDKVVCGVYGVALPRYGITEKRIMLGLKHGRENYFTDINYSCDRLYAVQKDIVLFDSTELSVRVDLLNSRRGNMELDGSFMGVFNERRTKVAAEYDGKEYRLTYDRKGNGTTLFGKETFRERSFHLTVPVSVEGRAELRLFMLFKGCKYELKCSFESIFGRLDDNSFYPLGNGIFATAEGGRIVTRPMDDKEQRMRFSAAVKRSAESGVSFKLRAAYRYTRFWFKGKNIWIFADDTSTGGGAAEDMFRYAMTRHDELYCYYLADKDSPAAERLIADGYKPLYTNTLLHKLLFLNAQVYLTTKPNTFPNNFPDGSAETENLARTIHMNTVMLQSDLGGKPSPAENCRLHDNVRLYFCGTKDYVDDLKKPEYGYEHTDVLRLTGLTAYDKTRDTSGGGKLLLILARFGSEEEAAFAETAFYERFKTLLENEALTNALTKSDCTLTIAFEGVTNDECKDLPEHEKLTFLTGDFDPDELKSRAALIVTDDGGELSAGLMRKPLIYFGGEGGMAFGERAETSEELAELLCGYIENGVTIKPEFKQAAEEYFGNDALGCRRAIYNEIITYLYENGEIDGFEDFETADDYDENE